LRKKKRSAGRGGAEKRQDGNGSAAPNARIIIGIQGLEIEGSEGEASRLILLAEKEVNGNTVAVQLGKLDEKAKEIIQKMRLEVEGLEIEEEIRYRTKHKKDERRL